MPNQLQEGTVTFVHVNTPVAGATTTVQELEKLRRVHAAAKNLVEQKGRHNTEIAYKRLVDVLHS